MKWRPLQFGMFFRSYRMTRRYLGWKLYAFIALNLLSVGAESVGLLLFIPFLTQVQVAETAADGKSSWIYFLFRWLGVQPTFTSTLLFLVAAFSFKGVAVFLVGAYRHLLLNQARRQIRGRLVDSYAQLDYRYTAGESAGFFGNLIVTEVDRAIGAMEALCRTLTALTTTGILLGVAIFLDWRISQFIVLAGLLALLIVRNLAALAKRYSRQESGFNRAINEFLIETLQAFKYLKSTAGFSRLQRLLEKANRDCAAIQTRRSVASAVLEGIQEPLLVGFIAAMVYYHVVILHRDIAPFVVSILLFYRCMIEINHLGRHWQWFNEQAGGLETLDQAARQFERHREPSGTRAGWSFARSIAFRNVSFAYANHQVLHHLNLTIRRNTTVALVGVSGSGKTTLVDLITGVLRPTGGEILVDDVNLRELDLSEYRTQIGYVTQETIVFADTIGRNISLQLGQDIEAGAQARIEAAARRSHCQEFIDRMPGGYGAMVGERGLSLSGGQRQRLAIARELFKEPQILILDEATSALDSESAHHIQQSLRELKGQMTVILIGHRLLTIRDADYIYVLDEGRIAEEGTYGELRQRTDGRFHRIWEMEQAG
jgi:ABC-type multidrug transport system fused ATPase/permease subunit